MTLKTLPGDLNKPNVRRKIDALAGKLRRRQITGSRDIALQTAKLIREVLANARFRTYEELQELVRAVGEELIESGRGDSIITNTSNRILTLISEEYVTAYTNAKKTAGFEAHTVPPTPALDSSQEETYFDSPTNWNKLAIETSVSSSSLTGQGSLQSSTFFALLGHRRPIQATPLASPSQTHFSQSTSAELSRSSSQDMSGPVSYTPLTSSTFNLAHALKSGQPATQQARGDTEFASAFSRKAQSLKPVFLDAIQEFIEEIEGTHRNVAEQALDHIHSGEFILTIGYSRTIIEFLKAAARKREFTVIVAETAPSLSGRDTATTLSDLGISTILIPDSNIFSLLPRCSKILLGPHLVMADGSAFCTSGALSLCHAASKLRVPAVVCGGTFKFCPLYPGDDGLVVTDLGSPEEVLELKFLEKYGLESNAVEILNPYYDVVPPDLISLYITNLGAHPASLLYRLLGDMYKPSSLE